MILLQKTSLRLNSRQLMTLHSLRLLLKRMPPVDALGLFQYRALPAVYQYQTWFPQTLQDAIDFIQNYSATDDIRIGQWKQFGIYLRDQPQLIGDCGFCLIEAEQAEIGYTIAPEFQGKGYGTEAVEELVAFLFQRIQVHRIIARTDPRNSGSSKILEKLHFRQEGHFKKSVKIRGEWQDDLLFALLREEWLP